MLKNKKINKKKQIKKIKTQVQAIQIYHNNKILIQKIIVKVQVQKIINKTIELINYLNKYYLF